MKLTKEEKKEAVRCLEFDIMDYKNELNMKKWFLKNILMKKEELKEDELGYLSRSIMFDLKERIGTGAEKSPEVKVMLNILDKAKQNATYN